MENLNKFGVSSLPSEEALSTAGGSYTLCDVFDYLNSQIELLVKLAS
jgi:hypothetical protein